MPSNTDKDVVECVSIGGTIIDLGTISPELRRQYRQASLKLGRLDVAKAELKRIGEAILIEQAFKRAPVVKGDHAVMKALMKR